MLPRNSRSRLVFVIALITLPFARVARPDKSVLTIEVHAMDIVVSQIPPGDDVFIFSTGQEPGAYYMRMVQFETTVTDDDHDGIITVAYPHGVSLRSVWVAIDLKSGDMTAGRRPGFLLDVSELSRSCFKQGANNALSSFELDRRSLEFVLVRPGKGVWRTTVEQGGSADEGGGKDGKLSLSPSHMHKSGDKSGSPPDSFSGGDTVVAIDPYSLQILTTRLAQ
jgi:hypothetical protein